MLFSQVLAGFFFVHGYTLFLCCSLLFCRLQHFLHPVEFQDMDFEPQTLKFTGFPAQIIQHEVDHLAGILI
ncbi:peptide deformylase [Acidaminococcus timonensis]|uniref:peptide deformylase n=1 Tax=Acidaminococcus timonensis TaxID=1871002 RepID=UPI0025992958|nr:peptide deformylase [uncultured Acidaminococcus sp.]